MYRNAYQRGMLTVFFSVGSKPLAIWDTYMQDGYITRFLDQDIKSMVLEIGGTNVSTTYMTCPKGNMVLGITMPFLVMIVKNLKKYFSFEVTILDESGTRRRFRVSNFQSSTQILPLCTVMPIGLSDGWNQIQFNLAEFTRRAYKKQFVEVQRLKINANIRLRRIYFTERLIPEDELPAEYKLFFPIASKKKRGLQSKESKPSSQQALKPMQSVAHLEQKPEETKSSKTSIHSIKKVSSEGKADVQKTFSVPNIDTENAVEKVPSEKLVSVEQVETGPVAVPEGSEEKEGAPHDEAGEQEPTNMGSKLADVEPLTEEPETSVPKDNMENAPAEQTPAEEQVVVEAPPADPAPA
ncbi:cilia- and flagella-associated protein 20-like [Pieris brassicae]|uniref:cilia- and flagella-associated protein 20-like n=1 Tax=Pieris brassicae TaxID=7116 RepID=UPI001E65E71B|nr:cilia- and flagella-associated protein 20-like [Pieris brassicae]